jgi:dTDP-glucose 4,6-dehydratase
LNYVQNTINGFILAGSKEKAIGLTINLGSGTEISIRDLAIMIAGKVGISPEIEQENLRIRPEGSEVERLLADNRLARDLLGWKPEVDLSSGLDTTIEWVRGNAHYYRPGVYTV